MKYLEKKLEIMKYIYEHHFEPDLWVHDLYLGSPMLFPEKKISLIDPNSDSIFKSHINHISEDPWYSLEHLLTLIRKEGHYYQIFQSFRNDLVLSIYLSNTKLIKAIGHIREEDPSIIEKTDPHLEYLKLFKEFLKKKADNTQKEIITLSSSLENLELAMRAWGALRRKGMSTVKDLIDYADQYFIGDIQNVGKKTTEEIIHKLRELGYAEIAEFQEEHHK